MKLLPAEHLSIGIEKPFAEVSAFLAVPANFTRWAAGLAESLHRDDAGIWRAKGPAGEVTLRFARPNDFGIADHSVRLPDGGEVHVPLRVVANGEGSEVLFTLFRQPGMSDAEFARDIGWVKGDLATLKAVLEAGRMEDGVSV